MSMHSPARRTLFAFAGLLVTLAGASCATKDPPLSPAKIGCATDAECRAFSNYCDGCACEALATGDKEPACGGTIVQCFVDPCRGRSAVCKSGQCVLAPAP